MKPHQSLPGLWQLAMTLGCPLSPFIPIVCVGHSSHVSSQAPPPEPPTARSHPQNTLTALMAGLAPPTSTWNPTNIHPGKLHPEKFHPSPQASLYKRCSVLCWAEADTLLGFFLPLNLLGEIYLGYQLPGYLSISAVTLTVCYCCSRGETDEISPNCVFPYHLQNRYGTSKAWLLPWALIFSRRKANLWLLSQFSLIFKFHILEVMPGVAFLLSPHWLLRVSWETFLCNPTLGFHSWLGVLQVHAVGTGETISFAHHSRDKEWGHHWRFWNSLSPLRIVHKCFGSHENLWEEGCQESR